MRFCVAMWQTGEEPWSGWWGELKWFRVCKELKMWHIWHLSFCWNFELGRWCALQYGHFNVFLVSEKSVKPQQPYQFLWFTFKPQRFFFYYYHDCLVCFVFEFPNKLGTSDDVLTHANPCVGASPPGDHSASRQQLKDFSDLSAPNRRPGCESSVFIMVGNSLGLLAQAWSCTNSRRFSTRRKIPATSCG